MKALSPPLPHVVSDGDAAGGGDRGVMLIVCRALSNRIPGPIVALLWRDCRPCTCFKLPVETIGTRFGGIPSGLPHLADSDIPRAT